MVDFESIFHVGKYAHVDLDPKLVDVYLVDFVW